MADNKFVCGIVLGVIAGALLFDSSKDVQKLVEKGKEAVQNKVESIKNKA